MGGVYLKDESLCTEAAARDSSGRMVAWCSHDCVDGGQLPGSNHWWSCRHSNMHTVGHFCQCNGGYTPTRDGECFPCSSMQVDQSELNGTAHQTKLTVVGQDDATLVTVGTVSASTGFVI